MLDLLSLLFLKVKRKPSEKPPSQSELCVAVSLSPVTGQLSLRYSTMHIGKPVETTDKTCLPAKLLFKK